MKSQLDDSPGSCIASIHHAEENPKRVQFASINNSIHIIHSSSGDEIVRRMPWTDHKGATGWYTGRVNIRMQPHGRGVMVYNHRTFNTCIWANGIPTMSWVPKQAKHKRSTYHSSKQKRQAIGGGTKNDTYLHHLELGDTATPQDMMMVNSHHNQIDSLRLHDFVFILRSDKQTWTYAIIANRQENIIHLVVDTAGSTKVVSRRNWATSIRLVRPVKKDGDSVMQQEVVSENMDDGMVGLIDSLPARPPFNQQDDEV